MAAANEVKKDPPKDPKEMLAEVDLASWQLKRAEAVEKQKEAVAAVQVGKAGHFLRFWLGGGALLLAAIWLGRWLPEEGGRIAIFLLSAAIVGWLAMWVLAFFPTSAVWKLQDQLTAANKRIIEIDLKIAFCHQVQEETKKAKVQKYAQVLLNKDAPKDKDAT
jgi:hypothetical protein